MGFLDFRSLAVGALGALATLCAAGAPSAASADVQWRVNGTFDDGTTLTGTFSVNVYGFLDGWDLTTDANGVYTSFDYDPATAYVSNTSTSVDFYPQVPAYDGDLHILFADDLTIPEAHDGIVTDGASFECQASFSCPGGDATRYLVDGFATYVPEPATWAMMILGLGLVGVGLRANIVATRRLAELQPGAD